VIDTSPGSLAFLLVAGLVAGAVNAAAGGGSLLVFPSLLAVGLSPLAANVTNSIAQWPGYLGIVAGVRRDLRGQGRRVLLTSVVSAVGSAVGCALLLVLPSSVFDAVVPALVLLASGVFASVYGGYFGGALGVILIATLSLFAHDSLVRLNALKGLLSLVVATVTVVYFAIGAPVYWAAVAVLAPTTLVGGYIGARIARRSPEAVLRAAVVLLGMTVGIYLLVTA
jgi:uncharacterized protein